MNTEIAAYLETTLSKIAILEENNVGYEGVELFDFVTTYEDGKPFTHANGDRYGIAYLNAMTRKSANTIAKALKKKNKGFNVTMLTNLVAEQRLKCYVHENAASFNQWEPGTIGVASLQFDDEKQAIIPSFITE